ncbi:MAG: VOC family protein [Deltaproteobacteria bacterium]|jgi:PhnB protein
MTKIDPIPPGPRLIPYLSVQNAQEALAYYRDVLDAKVSMQIAMPDGRLGHAELDLPGGVRVYIADEFPEEGFAGPQTRGGTTVSLVLYVEDVDVAAKRATDHGAKLDCEIADTPHGERTAKIVDPFGHRWMLVARTEELSEEEILRRYGQ